MTVLTPAADAAPAPKLADQLDALSGTARIVTFLAAVQSLPADDDQLVSGVRNAFARVAACATAAYLQGMLATPADDDAALLRSLTFADLFAHAGRDIDTDRAAESAAKSLLRNLAGIDADDPGPRRVLEALGVEKHVDAVAGKVPADAVGGPTLLDEFADELAAAVDVLRTIVPELAGVLADLEGSLADFEIDVAAPTDDDDDA